jgi:hypothetical protein
MKQYSTNQSVTLFVKLKRLELAHNIGKSTACSCLKPQ